MTEKKPFDLEAFRAARDAALEQDYFTLWNITKEELNAAYAAGERVFRRADLRGADLEGADLRRAVLRGADLEGADLRRAVLEGADLEGAVLRRAVLRGADLEGADLEGADLEGADLEGADLRRAVLRGADLRGADLEGADLEGAVLRGADLRWADLEGAVLEGADLRRAVLRGADSICQVYIPGMSSRGDYLYAVNDGSEVKIKAGCFWGTLDEFVQKVQGTHGSNANAQLYLAQIEVIRLWHKFAQKDVPQPETESAEGSAE